ncbi:peptidoglycan-binding protein [Streptomyces sp. NPDC005908]|uniref:peptidoglycan-binding protein n=1 Tax=Streptomyces sp. NPDC005908 TaxID=3157084 RepID=UPI0033C417C5
MSVEIISRAQWGARPWDDNPRSSGPARVPLSKRTEFFVHWFGGVPAHASGAALAREVERLHMDGNGWAGVGYNWIIGEDGTAYEGRGWDRQGAHCPGHNVSGLAVLIAVGKGGKKASKAALATARALYDEACKRTGHALAQRGHRDGIATECPGPDLYAWVRAGMPAEDYTPPAGGTAPAAWDGKSFPGRDAFQLGKSHPAVTKLGERLTVHGYGRFYKVGPGPEFTTVDRDAVEAYQKAQGWTGADADGYPGPETWRRLMAAASAKPQATAPTFPGRDKFRPGAVNEDVTRLGRQLVKKGYGRHYTSGPGPRWTENDRRNVEAFQRAQGWTGSDADGYPGPETWRRLFA